MFLKANQVLLLWMKWWRINGYGTVTTWTIRSACIKLLLTFPYSGAQRTKSPGQMEVNWWSNWLPTQRPPGNVWGKTIADKKGSHLFVWLVSVTVSPQMCDFPAFYSVFPLLPPPCLFSPALIRSTWSLLTCSSSSIKAWVFLIVYYTCALFSVLVASVSHLPFVLSVFIYSSFVWNPGIIWIWCLLSDHPEPQLTLFLI